MNSTEPSALTGRSHQNQVNASMTASQEIEKTARDVNTADTLFEHAKSLRVAIISDAAPSRNGVGTFYVDLCTHLRKHLEHIEIISPTVEDGKWKAGLVFPLPGDATQKLCMPNPLEMRRKLKAIKPHLVLIATPGVYGVVGAFMAANLNIPAIAGFHTSFEKITELYWHNSLTGLIVHGYFKVSNGYLFKKCPLILANSQEMIDQARRIGAKNTRTVSTPISSVFTEKKSEPYSGKIAKVLFAGRLAPEKNIEAILEAAIEHEAVAFTLAGEGPLREIVEEQAKKLNNLSYVGWLDRDSLRDQLDKHDALILPSHFESFGTIALEAMARERLVIVSKQCGIVEWDEYNSGLVVIESSLSDTLASLIDSNENWRTGIARKAQKITEEINQKSIKEWCALFSDSSTLSS